MGDLIQKSIDISGKPFGLRQSPTAPVAPPQKQETVSSISTASQALRQRRRKGLAASILAGQQGAGDGKRTLG